MTLRHLNRPRIHLIAMTTVALIISGTSPERRAVHAQVNPIVTENLIAGSPQGEWDVSGSGDPTIQGYATDISVNKGDLVSFKIKLDANAAGYVIDVYRLGYYQGFGARRIGTVGTPTITPAAADIAAAKNQPACVGAKDPSALVVDCGNWSVTGSFDTTGLTSGIYIARPRRTDTQGASHIVFIVRDDSRQADVLFQTSDTTWQAYNLYPGRADGGSSLYCNGPLSNSGGDYGCPNRAPKVSYNRPFDTRDHDRGSWLFNGEYPMVRWMEANGYDMKYWSGVDTDRFGASPTIGLTSPVAPRAFLSVGHDEYWSGQQRTNVEAARNAGVSLAFFSGNEMFWKTRYEASQASTDGSSTAYRTLVSYKETFATGTDRLDPDATAPWTGTWRDPRFSPPLDGGRPENALTGTLWAINCCSDRIVVPAAFKNLRFWRNTAVAALQPGQVYLTPMETLGYEWDEDVDNGFRPDGLIRMSTTIITEPQKLLNYGTNVGPGSATHALTLYRHGTALVFGAGTVQWSWGLDSVHDQLSATLPDRAMQQATVNLFGDMGVQPQSLQFGADGTPLVPATASADPLAPTSSITSPVAGASAPSGTRITVTGQAIEHGGGAVAGVEVSVNGSAWHPALMPTPTTWAYSWLPGAVGQAIIRTRAIDDSGNLESPGPGVGVNVVAGDCPCTSLWKPSAAPITASIIDTRAVEVGVKFYSDISGFITGVRFYKGPGNINTHVGNLWSSTGTLLATATFVGESGSGWQEMSFPSPVAIDANTRYVISYHTNVGGYAADDGYFGTVGVDSAPLHAAASTVNAGNGLFTYGVSQFPTQTFNGANYWVDVVFSPSLNDTTPPVISQIKATMLDSTRVTVTWTTNEPATSKILYGTDPALLTSTTLLPPGTQTINQAAFTTQHSIALQGLASNTTYYYRVISIDRSGNDANVAAPTFTVPGPTLRDTASSDFAAGTATGTYVAETADGELILAPTIGTEFSGTAIGAGWLSVPWETGGSATVANGLLTVDGSRFGTCADNGTQCTEQWLLSPGHRLEFTGIFSGDPFQHTGFGQTLEGWPWAIFSTGDGGTLYARTLSATASVNEVIPNGASYLGFPHRYAIEWTDTSVKYYIDGALVVTHAIAIAGPMRPIAASDFSLFGGNIIIDWLRLSPYASTGSFESRVFDATSEVDWHTIQWTAKAPAGTSIGISVRVGDTATSNDGSWGAWQAITSPGALTLRSRYIQYRADLSTSDPNVTPSLEDIIITTGHAPVAVDDHIVVAPNSVTTLPPTGAGSLVANDIDGDSDPLEVVAVGPAAHGAVALNFDGSVRYTPATGYLGPDSFVYTTSDGLMTSSATVSVDVSSGPPPNVAPQFTKGADQSVNEDALPQSIAGWATGISAGPVNESAQTVDFLVSTDNVALFSAQPAVSAAGTLTFTPAPDANGMATVTVKAHDNGGVLNGGIDTSNAQTFTIAVAAVNDAPNFKPGPDQNVNEDAAAQSVLKWATAISAGPADEAKQTVAFTVIGNSNPNLFLAAPAVSASGTLTYTLAPNTSGGAKITLVAKDTGGGADTSAPVSFAITVTNVNDAPSFTKGANVTVLEDAPAQSIAPWATAISAGPSDESSQTFNFIVSNSSNGLFATQPAVSSSGTLTFTPAPNANGVATVTVQLRDSGGVLNGGVDTSAPQTFTITVTPVNDVPSFAIGLNQAVNEDAGPQTVLKWASGLSAGPANESAQTLSFIVGNSNRALFTAAGQPAVDANGTLTFTTAPDANGSVKVAVQIHDSGGVANGGADTSAIQTFTIDIAPVNDNPVAGDDTATLPEDNGATAINVLANDSIGPDTGETLSVTAVTQGAHGSVKFTATGVVYTPLADYNGSDSFTYTISDGNGGSAIGKVGVTVTPVNDDPVAIDDAATLPEDSPATSINVLANDTIGPDTGETLTVAAVTQPLHGRVTFTATAVSYTPDANYNGPDSFSYAIGDGNGGRAKATVNLTVTPVNDNPVATADTVTVLEDSAATAIDVLANDSIGPDTGETLTIASVTQGAHGSVKFTATGVVYTPLGNYNGADSFGYTIGDGNGGVARATVNVTVTAVNDAPSFVKGADQSSAAGAGPQTITAWATGITAGPADEAAQALTFAVTTDNAALFAVQPSIAANGTLTFTPAASGGGVAHVTATLSDNGGVANGGVDTSVPATFSIVLPFPTTTTLVSPNLAPTTYGQSVTLTASVTSAGGTPTGSVAFTDNGNLLGTAALVNGAASLTTGAIGAGTRTVTAVYNPAPGFLSSQASLARTVNAAATTTTLTPTLSVQYSDMATFETTVTGSVVGAPAGSASFKVGTLVVGTANLVWDAAAGLYRAKYVGPLVEPAYTPTGGALKPAAKIISVVYNNVSPNYTLAGRNGSMSIKAEDATVSYVGTTSTTCTTCSAVVVTLKAKVSELDTSLGDLRNASVTFVNRTTGATIATVAAGADGIASFNWTVNLGTATSQTTKIGMMVTNYYLRNNTADDGTVVITKQ